VEEAGLDALQLVPLVSPSQIDLQQRLDLKPLGERLQIVRLLREREPNQRLP